MKAEFRFICSLMFSSSVQIGSDLVKGRQASFFLKKTSFLGMSMLKQYLTFSSSLLSTSRTAISQQSKSARRIQLSRDLWYWWVNDLAQKSWWDQDWESGQNASPSRWPDCSEILPCLGKLLYWKYRFSLMIRSEWFNDWTAKTLEEDRKWITY